MAKHLEESPLNPTQTLAPQGDGRIQLVADVEDTAQLRWWILAFGDQVEIVEPDKLRKEICDTFEKAIKRYL